MIIVDQVPESACSACRCDGKMQTFLSLILFVSRHYDDLDSHDILLLLDAAAKATRARASTPEIGADRMNSLVDRLDEARYRVESAQADYDKLAVEFRRENERHSVS